MDYRTINHFMGLAREYGQKHLKESGISNTECLICSYVYSNNICTQDDVVKELKMEKSTVTKALQSLEKKNYLIRTTDSVDKRKKIIELTVQGKKNSAKIFNIHDKWLISIMDCLTDEEKKQFDLICGKMIKEAEVKTNRVFTAEVG